MSKLETIVVPVDTRQLERAVKLTKELIALGKQVAKHPLYRPEVPAPKGRTLDRPKGRTA